LAGVIFSAPFFGLPEYAQKNPVEKLMFSVLSNFLDELVVMTSMPMHRITRNRAYNRSMLTQTRSNPLLSMKLFVSVMKNQDRLMTYASQVTYPYLLVLGEKDMIINNAVNRQWHSKT
jgi:alpha-beta hydrolase superfamily lysophospholipase